MLRRGSGNPLAGIHTSRCRSDANQLGAHKWTTVLWPAIAPSAIPPDWAAEKIPGGVGVARIYGTKWGRSTRFRARENQQSFFDQGRERMCAWEAPTSTPKQQEVGTDLWGSSTDLSRSPFSSISTELDSLLVLPGILQSLKERELVCTPGSGESTEESTR